MKGCSIYMPTSNYFTTEKSQSQYLLIDDKMPYAAHSHRARACFANSHQVVIVWFQSCLQRYPKVVSKSPKVFFFKVDPMLSLSCPEDVLKLSQCCQEIVPKFSHIVRNFSQSCSIIGLKFSHNCLNVAPKEVAKLSLRFCKGVPKVS